MTAQNTDDAELVARARGIHERVLTLDTHVDINPDNFTAARSYATRLDTQVNLPKMEEGGLDAAFFVVYVGQTDGPEAFTPERYTAAYAQAVRKFDAIHHLVESLAPGRIGLARSAADVREIAASGRKVALIGVENGYPLGQDVARVREFHGRGARYLSLAHNGHSQLSDSNTGERDNDWRWNGLSPLGREVVGISSDFDGGGGVVGWNDAAETFNVTLEFVRRGYTEDEVAKLWSGNLLRVMEAVERVADQ